MRLALRAQAAAKMLSVLTSIHVHVLFTIKLTENIYIASCLVSYGSNNDFVNPFSEPCLCIQVYSFTSSFKILEPTQLQGHAIRRRC